MEVPRNIWGRKTRACCRGRSGMETDQHPRRETWKEGWVSFTATPHLSSQGADPQTSRLAFSLHTHTHTHTTALRDPITPPHSQETLRRTVLSRVTCWNVTRQVRLVPWSWALGVRVISEEWRVSGFMASRASPAQENRRGCSSSQASDSLQVSFVGRPDSRGSRKWMSGFPGEREMRRRRCLDAGVWGPRGSGSQLLPSSGSLVNPQTPRPGAGRAPIPCSCSNRGVSMGQGPLLGPLSYLSPANSAFYLCNCISHHILSPLGTSRLLSRSAWPV